MKPFRGMEGDGSEDGDGPVECHRASKKGESSEAAKGVPPLNPGFEMLRLKIPLLWRKAQFH